MKPSRVLSFRRPDRKKIAPDGARRGRPAPRSYGSRHGAVKARLAATLIAAALCGILVPAGEAAAADRTIHLVALGDSLTAGYGLPAQAAFPVRLQQALAAKGLNVEVANAGVSGDTTADGLARLDWSVPDGTDGVILELGANDMLRALDPQRTRATLQEIVRRLSERHVAVLLCGMLAAPNFGPQYADAFNAVYPDLAAADHLQLYPFFLAGVAANPSLLQRDGLHPTAAGVDVIVAGILPKVEALVASLAANRP
jgi:acyl-CoA thioesterase I